jgi:hypothetical protein
MRKFNFVVKDDEHYKSFMSKVKSGVFDVDFDLYIKEIENMHLTRSSRRMTIKRVLKNAQKQILTVSAQDSAYRSRCVEIKMSCLKRIFQLEEQSNALRRYLALTYIDNLNEFSTEKFRNMAIDDVMKIPNRRIKKLEEIKVLADLVIEDIDATGWTIKRIIESLSLYARDTA